MLTAANSAVARKVEEGQETPASPPTDFPTLVLPSPPKAPMAARRLTSRRSPRRPKGQAQMLKALAPQKVARPKAQRAPGEESPAGQRRFDAAAGWCRTRRRHRPRHRRSVGPQPGVLGRYIDPFQRIGGAPTDDSTPPRRRSRPSRAQERRQSRGPKAATAARPPWRRRRRACSRRCRRRRRWRRRRRPRGRRRR